MPGRKNNNFNELLELYQNKTNFSQKRTKPKKLLPEVPTPNEQANINIALQLEEFEESSEDNLSEMTELVFDSKSHNNDN